jgi:hypothetical protein
MLFEAEIATVTKHLPTTEAHPGLFASIIFGIQTDWARVFEGSGWHPIAASATATLFFTHILVSS